MTSPRLLTFRSFTEALSTISAPSDRIDYMIENVPRMSMRDQIKAVEAFENNFTSQYQGYTHQVLGSIDKIRGGFSEKFNRATNEFTAPQSFTQLLKTLLGMKALSLRDIEEKRQLLSEEFRFFPTVRKVKGDKMAPFLKSFEKHMDHAPIRTDLSHYWSAIHFASREATALLEDKRSQTLRKPHRGRKLF